MGCWWLMAHDSWLMAHGSWLPLYQRHECFTDASNINRVKPHIFGLHENSAQFAFKKNCLPAMFDANCEYNIKCKCGSKLRRDVWNFSSFHVYSAGDRWIFARLFIRFLLLLLYPSLHCASFHPSLPITSPKTTLSLLQIASMFAHQRLRTTVVGMNSNPSIIQNFLALGRPPKRCCVWHKPRNDG